MQNPTEWRQYLANVNIEALPRKWLPAGNPMGLYWLMVSWLGCIFPERAVPSSSVFSRVWRSGWHETPRFRKRSQHAMCSICWNIRRAIRGLKGSTARKLELSRQLKKHWADQFMDRIMYWSFRECSRLRVDSLLCIIIDSMDRSKTIFPRFASHATSKELEKLPNCAQGQITLSLAHGFGAYVFMGHEGSGHGSNSFLTILFRTLELVRRQCLRKGWRWPSHIVIQADMHFVFNIC